MLYNEHYGAQQSICNPHTMEESSKPAYRVHSGTTKVSEMMLIYNWRIESISSLLRINEFELSSPIFSFDGNTEWQLMLSSESNYSSEYQVSIALFKVSEDGKSHNLKYDVQLGDGLTEQLFVSQTHFHVFRNRMEKKPCTVYPLLTLKGFMKSLYHDLLLIRCCMTMIVGESPVISLFKTQSLLITESCSDGEGENNLSRVSKFENKTTNSNVAKAMQDEKSLSISKVSQCENLTTNSNVEMWDGKSLNISTDNFCDIKNHDVPKQLNEIERISEDLESLSEDLESLFINKNSCDVVLYAGGVEVEAHRAILSARSPYLSKLLEGKKDSIDLPGMNVDILNALLSYLYTGKIHYLSPNVAIKLLKTAIAYEILSLEKYCNRFLKSNLNPQCMYDVLLLTSEVVTLRDLKMAVVRFIMNNNSEIMTSNAWSSFAMENPRIIAEILLALDSIKKNEKYT